MSSSWESSTAAPAVRALPAPGDSAQAVLARLRRVALPELWALLALTSVLDVWDLGRNRWANVYYSGAVRSMSSSWHDFLFASLDRAGVMSVDKPPLALWVQSLSVRVFGFHPISILLPEALMGIATVVLVYDLVRRRFGRVGGFAAGLALALTPMTVAISRHNNPDALLVLCCVAALWCFARGLERGRTRWLVAAGVCVGLGFETKMLIALVVVPAMVAAWLWIDPAGRGRLRALGQLVRGGAAMLLVGGAWPALVELTPAADRPWVSGTSDNRILSLIFEYNGVGRVSGQAGGPGALGAGPNFGGSAGPLRLLDEALGGQASWLLGFALVTSAGLLVATRLRRSDARSGWLLVVGGSFLTTAVLFSFAGGIFHPYYVSLLAPFLAALLGAGVAALVWEALPLRALAPAAILAGVAIELVVRSRYPGQLPWLPVLLVALGVLATVAILLPVARRPHVAALCVAFGALLIAPAAWAFDTLGYATSSTFPAGGPQSASLGGPGAGGRARLPIGGGSRLRQFGAPAEIARAPGGGPPGLGTGAGTPGSPGAAGAPGSPGAAIAPGSPGAAGAPGSSGAFAASPFGGDAALLNSALVYVGAHGGGTLAVSSQSAAASAIIAGETNVAGIGGFSGRESEVSVSWLAGEVSAGKIRWVLDEESAVTGSAPRSFGAGGFGSRVGGQAPGGGLAGAFPGRGSATRPGGDTRAGSRPAMRAVARACARVTLPGGSSGALYDCRGRASALSAA